MALYSRGRVHTSYMMPMYRGRGRLSRRTNRRSHRHNHRQPNHLAVMVTTVLSCLLLICFLIYDLVIIYQFFSAHNTTMSADISDQPLATTHQSVEEEVMQHQEILDKIESYNRQRALAAVLLVMMLLQMFSGVAVYFGFEKKTKRLLLGYLVLTFPVMTFAMVYAILFMVHEVSTILYVKIASVILVYTIQANLYRMVYRMFQFIKHQERRSSRSPRGQSNEGYDVNSADVPPVHIQLKPPPYEKEPPPYDLKSPGVNPSLACEDPVPEYSSSHQPGTSTVPPPLTTDTQLSLTLHIPDQSTVESGLDNPVDTDPEDSVISYDVPPPGDFVTSIYHIHQNQDTLPPPPYTEYQADGS